MYSRIRLLELEFKRKGAEIHQLEEDGSDLHPTPKVKITILAYFSYVYKIETLNAQSCIQKWVSIEEQGRFKRIRRITY